MQKYSHCDTTLPKFINLFSSKVNVLGRTTRWQLGDFPSLKTIKYKYKYRSTQYKIK